MASFSCNNGYTVSGSSIRTCQTSGNWEQPIPTCTQSNENKLTISFLEFSCQYLLNDCLLYYLPHVQKFHVNTQAFITVPVTCVSLSLSNGGIEYNSSEVSVARYSVSLWLLFHVAGDSPYLDLCQALARFQEFGISTHQYAAKVMNEMSFQYKFHISISNFLEEKVFENFF